MAAAEALADGRADPLGALDELVARAGSGKASVAVAAGGGGAAGSVAPQAASVAAPTAESSAAVVSRLGLRGARGALDEGLGAVTADEPTPQRLTQVGAASGPWA